MKRVFAERGLDFFDKTKNGNLADIVSKTVVEAKDSEDEAQTEKSDMTTEEMREMCIKIAESLGCVAFAESMSVLIAVQRRAG